MALIYPRRSQRAFSNTAAPISPQFAGGDGGSVMMHPTLPAPRARAAAAPAAPYPAGPYTPPPVVTSHPAPFQLSLNRQRANTATSAANFAQAAPLPMAPVSVPAPTSTPGTPTTEYNGAYGVGPDAQKLAETARAGYIDRQHATVNESDLGPSVGLNSYANKTAADEAAAHPFVSPKDRAINTWTDTIAPSIVRGNDATTAAKGAYTDQTNQMTPVKVAEGNANAGKATAQGQAALKRADSTAADKNAETNAAREQRLSGKADPAIAQMTRDNAHDITTAAGLRHTAAMKELSDKQRELSNQALTTEQRTAIANDILALKKNVSDAQDNYDKAIERAAQVRKGGTPAAKGAAATQPTAGVQPGASAAPATGPTLYGHDPKNRTPEAIAETARNRGISEDEVLRRLGVTA